MSVKYFVISLQDQVARRKNIGSILKANNVEFEFFDATYGKAMTEEEQKLCSNECQTILTMKGNRKVLIEDELSLSEKGCALSHLRLYQQIIDQDLDYAVIMEDDLKPNSYVFQAVNSLSAIKEPWDVVHFSSDFGIKCMPGATKHYFDKDKGFYFQRIGMRNDTLDAIFNRRRFIITTSLYVVTKDACKRLVEIGYPVRLTSDYLLGMVGYNNLKIFAVYPKNHFMKLFECESTIGSSRPAHKMVRL